MELYEFDVRDPSSSPVSASNTVARRNVWICGVRKHSAQAASRQQGSASEDLHAFAGSSVQGRYADHLPVRNDEVHERRKTVKSHVVE